VNGDTLTHLDVAPLLRSHDQSGALVTMAVVPNRESHKYSGLAVAGDGSVTGVVPRGASQASFHFFGVQVAEAAAFASVPDGVPYETVRTLYPALIAARPGSVRAFVTEAEYLDIGTAADYLNSSLALAQRESRSTTGDRVVVANDALIERSVLWDDVVVETGAMVRECVVADGVRVPADTAWHGVTLRVAAGELAAGERRIGDLAVCSI
jgi:mannose-1-phosphate guanylyltransferase